MHSSLFIALSVTLALPVTGKPMPLFTSGIFPRQASDYIDAVVNQHNYYRSIHSAPAISWDAELAAYAQQLASSCVFGDNTSIGPGGYGQNIAADGSISASPSDDQADVVTNTIDNDWYANEVNNFTPYYGEATVPFNDDYLHFTQLVWKASVNVGCASSYCPAGTVLQGSNLQAWYTVCNYSPAGNVQGQFAAEMAAASS